MSKRDCLKCGEYIPYWVKIDGRKKNLKSRKYCLMCSPYGGRNTKQLHIQVSDGQERECKRCGKKFNNKKSAYCGTCCYRRQIERRHKKVYDLVGTKCWKCGYDNGLKGTPILDFHHVNPDEKKFPLGNREIAMHAWDRIVEEIEKCILLCCRCHREVHYGFITEEEVRVLKKDHSI